MKFWNTEQQTRSAKETFEFLHEATKSEKHTKEFCTSQMSGER